MLPAMATSRTELRMVLTPITVITSSRIRTMAMIAPRWRRGAGLYWGCIMRLPSIPDGSDRSENTPAEAVVGCKCGGYRASQSEGRVIVKPNLGAGGAHQ